MNELNGRWHPDDWEVLAAFWRAVVNVYEPWTEPGRVPLREQQFALQRVERARQQMSLIAVKTNSSRM